MGGGGGGGVGWGFFFFKQKTAYEIGTGDWSSDVCSSDLILFAHDFADWGILGGICWSWWIDDSNVNDIFIFLCPWLVEEAQCLIGLHSPCEASFTKFSQIGRASCRERV